MLTKLRWVGVLPVFPALLLAGCSEVKGSITDLETGLPIEDAKVGLFYFPAYSILPSFPEVARTDAAGQYQFTHLESNPWIYVTAPGYLTQAEPLPKILSLTRNFKMQSVEDLLGDWDVEITIDGTIIGDTRFVFTESGIEWYSSLGFVGEITFAFDGSKVVIDRSALAGDDNEAGLVSAILTFEKATDTLTGEIWLDRDGAEDKTETGWGTLVGPRVGGDHD